MTAVATFHLKRPCGRSSGFCMHCGNAFVTGSCGNVRCENAVSNICLTAEFPSRITRCDFCKDSAKAEYYFLTVSIAPRLPGYPDGISWGPLLIHFSDEICDARYTIGDYNPYPSEGSSNNQTYFEISIGQTLQIGNTPFPPNFTFRFVEDVEVDDGCMQVLHLVGNENSLDTAVMHPVIE